VQSVGSRKGQGRENKTRDDKGYTQGGGKKDLITSEWVKKKGRKTRGRMGTYLIDTQGGGGSSRTFF